MKTQEEEEKGFIERVNSPTPKRDKFIGKLSTAIGTACGAILLTGMVLNPIGIVALIVGATVFGGKAVYHAQKVDE